MKRQEERFAGSRAPVPRARRSGVMTTLGALCVALLARPGVSVPAQQDTFAGRVAALSEPAGYFDTDNLISNERSYLHVAAALDAVRPGGAYVGVGPDQNFSYIAITRPAVAIIVDIRRDNLLLHLLFKALFEMSGTRVEYLAGLTGRAPPLALDGWAGRSLEDIVRHVDTARTLTGRDRSDLDGRIATAIGRFGVPLSEADHATIRRFHGRFVAGGLSLQFNSAGRPPQWNYPTYRDLLLETDRQGRRRSYLASETSFQFVRALQAKDLVVPVVGDLAGPKALAAIGRYLAARHDDVTALYASNVEFYLFGDGRFDRFVANLRALPLADTSVVIRSAFRGGAPIEPGYNSASLTQSLPALLEGHARGRFRRYGELLAGSR